MVVMAAQLCGGAGQHRVMHFAMVSSGTGREAPMVGFIFFDASLRRGVGRPCPGCLSAVLSVC